MSGGGHPKDNSVQLQQDKFAHDDAAAKAATQATNTEHTRLNNLAGTAKTNAQSIADAYFNQMGVDPSAYEGIIGNLINAVSVPQYDANPGSYYSNVGQNAYTQAETQGQNKAKSAIDALFDPNFEYTKVADTTDDPFLSSINAEQRQTAEQFLNNMRARGVITDSGYGAAEKDLDRQGAGVMANLNSIGAGTLATERSNLTDIINRGRSAASGLKLGTAFDPNSYSTQVESQFRDFMNNLGQTLRGKVTGNLYDTSGLPVIAGAAQGAGNSPISQNLGALFEDPNKDKTDASRTNTSTGVV